MHYPSDVEACSARQARACCAPDHQVPVLPQVLFQWKQFEEVRTTVEIKAPWDRSLAATLCSVAVSTTSSGKVESQDLISPGLLFRI